MGGLVWGFGGWSVVVVVGVGRWLAAAGLLVVGARCLVVCGLRQLFCGSWLVVCGLVVCGLSAAARLIGEGLPFASQTGPSLRGTSFPLSMCRLLSSAISFR